MLSFTSKDRLGAGMPAGGMGAGKLELLPNGLFNAFTFQNNWTHPISGHADYPGILGYHLGISIDGKAHLLQTVPVSSAPVLKNIRYQASFPTAELIYEIPESGVEVSLEFYSPWIPLDAKNSSLPAVCFDLKVKNLKKTTREIGFIFIGRNLSGEWCVGRRNRVKDEQKYVSLEFLNEGISSKEPSQGSLRFTFQKDHWKTSTMEYWNAVTKNFSFTPENISLLGWEIFAKEGSLPNSSAGHIACGENQELCGAVAATKRLEPGEEAHLIFNAAWFFPNHASGHRYEKWFKNSAQVSSYVSANRKTLKEKINSVQQAVFELPFPRWFNEALLTNLSPFFSATWYVKDGRFAFYEAPVVCPLMGTIDVGFYGSIPLAYFFPELEISQIQQFAAAQRSDGYIPHDLGKNRIDLPSNGTTFYLWKDLNPKFILLVYRDYLWSGANKTFLRKMYPSVKKALEWSLRTDTDGNGLPDNEGADQTFDLWDFQGTHAYTSGIFLAALLACQKMAGVLEDKDFARSCRSYFLKGSYSFEKELWNGEYFGPTCALSQLNGQWVADLLGLGLIAQKAKIKKALASIFKHNSRHSRYGFVNSVTAGGRLDRSNNHSKNIWCGMNYAFAGLCLTQGFPLNKVLKPVAQIWDNVTRVQKNPWNQPDMIDSESGKFLFGDSYYRNMAIWSIPIARALSDKKTATTLSQIKGNLRKSK